MLLCSLLWMITASICLEWSMADSVTQSPRAITVQDGESVSLNCAYDTNEAYYALYWYKQSPNGELIYIIHQYSESNSGRSGRYSVTFRKSDRTITLNVLSSHLKDSGIYFCGLRSTGYAGEEGTHLEIEPRFQETSVPSVFVMKNGTNVACLVKDFYPKTVEIQLHPDNNPSEGVVATADGKFSAVKLGQYKKDLDQINCTVWHNNKVVVASYKGSYSNSKISGSPLPKECYKPTAQIEKVNLLSITLLGFRVLLAKSIAVNFVLTIKFFLL